MFYSCYAVACRCKDKLFDVCPVGADVNEVDEFGDTALAIAERFGHKDGARHLFLFRWQVRAAQAEKVPEMPMYFHQQCDTTNPVWLSGTQVGSHYYISPKAESYYISIVEKN